MITCLNCIIKYEIIFLLRNKGGWVPVLLLYGLTVALFGFSFSKDHALLVASTPAVIWVCTLFTMLTISELTLKKDIEEGWLGQLKVSGHPLWLFILGKSIAFWLMLASGFILLLPLTALWLSMDLSIILGVGLVYLVALPALILLMLLGVSLTHGLSQPGLLLGLLLLPLYVPILILGQSAVKSLQTQHWPEFELSLLGAVSILCIVFLPLLTDATLRQGEGI